MMPADDSVIWIAFSGTPRRWWLRLLRTGFRHCFAVIRVGEIWLTMDPMMSHLAVMTHCAPPDFDLVQFLKDQGLTLIQAQKNTGGRAHYLPMPYTCVEVMKRLLGLSAPLIFTPYSLYKTLEKMNQRRNEK